MFSLQQFSLNRAGDSRDKVNWSIKWNIGRIYRVAGTDREAVSSNSIAWCRFEEWGSVESNFNRAVVHSILDRKAYHVIGKRFCTYLGLCNSSLDIVKMEADRSEQLVIWGPQ